MTRRWIAGICVSWMAMMAYAAVAQTTSQVPESSSSSSSSSATPPTVVITAKAPDVVHKIDRTTYSLKDNSTAVSGTVADVLTTLPSVNVDINGNVTVRGSSTQIMVNGRPSAAFSGDNAATALQSLSANTISKIEVVTNPGAEFRADAATVINLVTKAPIAEKPTLTVIANAGPQARYNGTVSGTVSVGKWALNGAINLRQDIRYNIADSDRETFDSTGAAISHEREQVGLSVHAGVVNINGAALYTASDTDSINFEGQAMSRRRPRRRTDHLLTYDANDTDLIGDVTTVDVARQYFNNASFNSTYKHKGRREDELLTLFYRHDENENHSDVYYAQAFAVPSAPVSRFRRLRTSRVLQDELGGDYILPLGKDIQFKAGFDIEVDADQFHTLGSTLDGAGDGPGGEQLVDSLTTGFLVGTQLSAAYVDYEHPLGKWLVEGGLRLEQMDTRLRQSYSDPVTATSDVQWSPSFYLSRQLDDARKITFSYSRHIDRPAPEQLNPLKIFSDPRNASVGNPNLKPAETQSLEAQFNYDSRPVTFAGTAYVRDLRNMITDYSYYTTPGDTVLISSTENAGRGNTSGLDMSLDLHPSETVSVTLSSNVYRLSQTAPVDGVTLHQDMVTHETKLHVSWTPKKGTTFELQGQLNGRVLLLQGVQDGNSMLGLSFSHKVSPQLKLVATCADVLDTGVSRTRIRTFQYSDDNRVRIPGQIVYVGLVYKPGTR